MGRVYARGNALYLDFIDLDGERRRRRSGLLEGQEAEAAKLLEDLEARVAAHRRLADVDEEKSAGPVTVAAYAKRWLARRKGRVRTHGDEAARLRMHALPVIGELPIDKVRPRHIRDLVLGLRAAGKLAPRTVRHVFGTLHTMFRSAVTDELVSANP